MITSQTSSQVPILGPYRGKGWKIKKVQDFSATKRGYDLVRAWIRIAVQACDQLSSALGINNGVDNFCVHYLWHSKKRKIIDGSVYHMSDTLFSMQYLKVPAFLSAQTI